ncbi:MAG: tyrosine-type recombinase/integrase [Lysobacter sp.]|nr:tyrosine-type recombinase/integrase [Lysobacter sp.]
MQRGAADLERIAYRITDEYALVRQHRSPFLYLEWREAGKPVRRSTGHRDLEPAKRRARELILEHADIREAAPEDVPIAAVIDRHYLRHAQQLASKASYKASKKLWAAFYTTETIAQLTPARQRAFKAWLEARGLAPGYIRRVIGDGKAALNHAWQEGEITRVPFIKLPPVAKGYPHWAKFEELVRFLNTPMPEHLFAYCMIRLNTGCRGDAARDLQPFQIDWDAQLIDLNPPGRQQTKKFRPVVPLTDCLARYLRAQRPESFYVHWHGQHVDSIKTTWRKVRVAAGMPRHFAPKILRHTVGTELRRRGVPGWDISGQLGHVRGESAPTTENYAKFDPEYLARAKAAFDSWMGELAVRVPRLRDATAMKLGGGLRVVEANGEGAESRAVAGVHAV